MPIGNGPYRVTELKRGDHIRFQANPRYWRGKPNIPIIDLRIVPSVNTEMLLLRTHEIDLARVPASLVSQLPPSEFARSVVPSLGWMEVGFNLTNPILADTQVRRALMRAIDREKLAKVLGHGLYKTDRLMLPMFQWALDPTVNPPAFDPQAASQLLDDRGWRVGSDGLRHKDGQTLSLTMVFYGGGTGVLPATVGAELEHIHVAVEQKPVQEGLMWDTAAAGGVLATGKFDLALIGIATDPDPDIASWLFTCDQREPVGYNFSHYCNPAVDADAAQAASTFDRERRSRYLRRVQHALLRDAAFDPLYRIDTLWAAAPWLHGIRPSAYSPFWNVYDWTVADP
jgi:peptide/nickel transport system substrate-binding protein